MTNDEVITKTRDEITLRGLSENTAAEYFKSLRIFMRYYEGQPLEHLGEHEIREFLLYLLN